MKASSILGCGNPFAVPKPCTIQLHSQSWRYTAKATCCVPDHLSWQQPASSSSCNSSSGGGGGSGGSSGSGSSSI